MRSLGRLLLTVVAFLTLRRLRPPEPREPIVPSGPQEPRAELTVAGLLAASALLATGFIVVYALDPLAHRTQWLGLLLGGSLIAVAAALILIAKRLVVTEELEDDYPPEEHPAEQRMILQTVDESASRMSRTRLLKAAGAVSGGALGLALLVPLASLGPVIHAQVLYRTPWRRGRRLVDEHGTPIRASDIEPQNFYTAFPEAASTEDIASPVILVRLAPSDLRLPASLSGFPAAGGIVAFSKICTHAGCALTLYRAPLFQPVEPEPAFVCPCHYSTFTPGTGGTVVFGPAGRKLPMLPLLVDRGGFLRAAGDFDEPVGPSWSGVRRQGPT
jgi:ubiquinol-cytochrome c reductase iron-sulfur subunit